MRESGRRDAEAEVPFLFHQAALQDAGLHLILRCETRGSMQSMHAPAQSEMSVACIACSLGTREFFMISFFDSSPAC